MGVIPDWGGAGSIETQTNDKAVPEVASISPLRARGASSLSQDAESALAIRRFPVTKRGGLAGKARVIPPFRPGAGRMIDRFPDLSGSFPPGHRSCPPRQAVSTLLFSGG